MPPETGKRSSHSAVGTLLGWVGAVGTLATIAFALFPRDPHYVAVACLLIVTVVALSCWLVSRFALSRIPLGERRRNQHFLALVTDSQSSSKSPRRTASVCYGIEVSQVESFLKELAGLKSRLDEYVGDTQRACDEGERTLGDSCQILESLLADCTFIRTHHWVFEFLTDESCLRARDWQIIDESMRELVDRLEQRILSPLRQVAKKAKARPVSSHGAKMSRAERRRQVEAEQKQAFQRSAEGARLVVVEVLADLMRKVEGLRDQARDDFHEVL